MAEAREDRRLQVDKKEHGGPFPVESARFERDVDCRGAGHATAGDARELEAGAVPAVRSWRRTSRPPQPGQAITSMPVCWAKRSHQVVLVRGSDGSGVLALAGVCGSRSLCTVASLVLTLRAAHSP